MADQKVSDLTAASALGGTELFYGVQSAADVKITADQVKTFVGSGSPGGASLTIQYNNSSAFGGMSGTSWDDTNRSLTLTGATVTTSNPILNLSQTWNAGAVVFTALKLNVTNTASAAGSLLLDLQIGGTSAVKVGNRSQLTVTRLVDDTTDGLAVFTNSTSSLTISRYADLTQVGGGTCTFSKFALTSDYAYLDVAGLQMQGGAKLAWSSDGTYYGTPQTIIVRDANSILAQRNGTNAQTLRVYNTYTDASNYERGVFDWTTTANTLTIDVQVLGTGTQRVISLKHLDSSTGGGTATFASTNCPATTLTTTYTWIKFTSSDGSVVYVPAWK